MSNDLRDLRAKITVQTDAVLDSLAGGEGIERSEIVRDVLHCWALEQIKSIPETAKILKRRLQAEGIHGDGSGNAEGEAAQQRQSGL